MESRYPNVMCVVCEIVNSFVLELDNYVQVANQDVIIALLKYFYCNGYMYIIKLFC